MKTQNTTVEKIRKDLKRQQTQVIKLSNITEIEYNKFQFQIGLEILEAHLIEEEQSSKYATNRVYWNFFKMLWRNHERAVIYLLNEKQEYNWLDYQNKMQEMVECRRTWLSFHQFVSIQNKKHDRL